MNDVSFTTDNNGVEHATIEHADGSFTSMTKTRYEELEAAKAAAKP